MKEKARNNEFAIVSTKTPVGEDEVIFGEDEVRIGPVLIARWLDSPGVYVATMRGKGAMVEIGELEKLIGDWLDKKLDRDDDLC